MFMIFNGLFLSEFFWGLKVDELCPYVPLSLCPSILSVPLSLSRSVPLTLWPSVPLFPSLYASVSLFIRFEKFHK